MYEIYYTYDAKKDYKKITKSEIQNKALSLLNLIQQNPFINPPQYKKLRGDLDGLYSRRITIKHRLFYEVDQSEKRIKIMRMWSHYSN